MIKSWRPLYHLALNLLPETLIQQAKKHHYVKKLRSSAGTDEPDINIVNLLVQPGDTVLDIGANIGLYTKALSNLVGQKGVVYSIEPMPQTFDILTYVIARLDLKNVIAMQVAVSDKCSQAIMEVPRWSTGDENYYQAHIVEIDSQDSGLHQESIETATIDSILQEKNKITFVKCDVEGHELACINGATELLNVSKAAWLIEVSENPATSGSRAHRLFEIMINHGYTPWYFDGKKLLRWTASSKSINYFFLRDTHLKRLTDITSP